MKCLQQIQNALARIVTHTLKIFPTLLPHLNPLHWLKIEQRIDYKIISITHNLLHSSQPQYINKFINVKPSGKTCSSENLCISFLPLTSKLKYSNHSFRISAPHLWNSLPPNLRIYAPVSDETITNITHSSVSPTFKPISLSKNSHLKTYLFSLSFPIIPFSAVFHFPF